MHIQPEMTSVEDSPTVATPSNPRVARIRQWVRTHPWKTASAALLALILLPATVVYVKYYQIVSRTLRSGPFANSSNIFTAPRVVMSGVAFEPESIVAGLERAGYSTSPSNPKGWYKLEKATLEVHPGPDSYFKPDAALIRFGGKNGVELESLDGNKLDQYALEPELITNLVSGDREKRRLVRFQDIPPVLVQAVVSAEDKRFFQHLGLDPFRLTKAAYVDLKSARKEQGGSTITMQLARALWLDPEKRWRRKFSELMITLILEQRLSKEEIFEYYANQIYLGRRDSFSIHGFGEASRAFFDKDLAQITLPEAALLAGMIQRPSYFNPFRNEDRAKERRNLVLRLMHENGYIDAARLTAAMEAPIELSPRKPDAGDAPYFLALMNQELQSRLPERDDPDEESGGALQVYSTLDPDLQHAAVESVRATLPKIDKIVKAKRIAKDGAKPQVALVALDPRTGEVKAVVGGRDYAESQLNHALSMRQPGSVFKPFVYAAALSTAVDGSKTVFTPVSTVNDAPTTFRFGLQTYEPSNFGDTFYGTVTLRRAIAKSMNLATVSLAEKIGYGKVVDLAQKAGLNDKIQPTPAVALGAYEATPLEIAGAYTVFANRGEFVKPTFITKVVRGSGSVLTGANQPKRVLDDRVAFLMNSLLEGVVRRGTAAAAGSQLRVPAAGKTGTSRDGWFAGYTTDLLCVVWVGFDDNRELNIEGSKSALPVWTEFMKRAIQYRPGKRKFDPPPKGIIAVQVDPYSGQLAGPFCEGQPEYFIAGTQPRSQCQPSNDQFFGIGEVGMAGSADRSAIPARPASMEMLARPPR